MAFPATFPNSPQGYSFGCTTYGNRHAAFEYSGNLFAFVTQDGPENNANPSPDYRCHAMMSTDGGNTWVEQDASNAPGIPGGAPVPDFTNVPASGSIGTKGPQYTVAVDGSTALIFSVQLGLISGGATNVSRNQLIKFDLTAKTWNNSYITPTKVVDIQLNGSNPTSTTVGVTYAQLVVLGANDYVLIFSTTPETIGGTHAYARMAYARFDGTTMGSVVAVPGQSGVAFNFWPADAVLDENGLIHIFYQKNTFLDPSTTYHVSLDTASWTFGTVQTILTAQNYWQTQYATVTSTISKAIVYTPSGGTQKVAICLEVLDPTQTFETLSFFYADVAANPTWQQVDITSGADVTTGLSGTSTINLFPIPQIIGGASNASIDISEKDGTIVVAWNYVRQDSHQTGFVIYVTAPSDTLSFTSPATLFATGPIVDGSGDTSAVSVTTFPMTGGIGVLSDAQDIFGSGLGQGGEVMQFNLVPTTSTPLSIACPVDGGTAQIGVLYDKTLQISGGTQPYTVTIIP